MRATWMGYAEGPKGAGASKSIRPLADWHERAPLPLSVKHSLYWIRVNVRVDIHPTDINDDVHA